MNRRSPLFLAACAAVLSGAASLSAQAADADGPKTRAQVLAELEQARADGSFYAGGDGTPRGLARARLAEQQQKERERRAALRDERTDRAAQRAGS